MRTIVKHALVLQILGGIIAGASASAWAADEELEHVTVIGTRSHDRSAPDLAVPVDVVDGASLMRQGGTRMDSMLSTIVPSYNVTSKPIADAATLVRPANMRGLPPDSTLVLVNGKRRHRASVITFLGEGISDGSHGADISAIPAIALDRVEVLRDGAAAQYGSDAIAGILNFVLKDASEGGTLEARWGQYYYGDGENATISANIGLSLTERGFLNLSAEYNEADPTSRSVQRDDAKALIAAGNTDVRMPKAQIWGAPEIDDDYKLFANAGIDLADNAELYSFGSYAERTVEGGFFFRSPNDRLGVFTIEGSDGNHQYLLINPTGGDCPGTPNTALNDDGRPASGNYNANCVSFHQGFPGGFTPQFGADIEDKSIALGFRGETAGGLTYDVSAVWGEHESDFYMENTINPQLLGKAGVTVHNIPTSYDPGAYIETDYTINLDFTKEFDIEGLHSPLHVGFGVEHREEEFETVAGDENSTYVALDAQNNPLFPNLGVGSNGFAGFRPEDAGKHDRSSSAAYVDFEADVTERLLVNLAGRHEDPEQFDSTTDGKFALRYQATDELALRGSASTGFRVPTVGQANVRNTTTEFTGGVLSDSLTLPVTHPALVALGAGRPLEAEESVSYGVGAVINSGDLSITIDYYRIEVDDRIAQVSKANMDCLILKSLGTLPPHIESSKVAAMKCHSLVEADEDLISGDKGRDSDNDNETASAINAKRDDLFAAGVKDIHSITSATWFSNEFDTTTEGIDIVATYPMAMFGGLTDLTLAANYNRTEVDKRNPDNIDNKKVHQLEEALPNLRMTLTADHTNGPWRILARARYYGEHIEYHANDKDRFVRPEARWVHDLEVSYRFSEQFDFIIGAENIFDEEPTLNPYAGVAGSEYTENPAFDFNGGFYYVKARLNF